MVKIQKPFSAPSTREYKVPPRPGTLLTPPYMATALNVLLYKRDPTNKYRRDSAIWRRTLYHSFGGKKSKLWPSFLLTRVTDFPEAMSQLMFIARKNRLDRSFGVVCLCHYEGEGVVIGLRFKTGEKYSVEVVANSRRTGDDVMGKFPPEEIDIRSVVTVRNRKSAWDEGPGAWFAALDMACATPTRDPPADLDHSVAEQALLVTAQEGNRFEIEPEQVWYTGTAKDPAAELLIRTYMWGTSLREKVAGDILFKYMKRTF